MNSVELRALPADDLIARIAQGDRRAFGEFYDRYASRVLGLAIRLVINRAVGEEVAQEVFLELWKNAARYRRSKGEALSWVLTMTRMRAIDHIRAEQAARDRLLKVGIRDLRPDFDDVEDAVERTETKLAVVTALGALTEIQREAVVLYYSGYTHADLAQRLGIRIGTAKSRVHDGMAKLRSQAAVA